MSSLIQLIAIGPINSYTSCVDINSQDIYSLKMSKKKNKRFETEGGEIVDKLSILAIKKDNIKDNSKLNNIIKEYNYLTEIVNNNFNISKEEFESIITNRGENGFGSSGK